MSKPKPPAALTDAGKALWVDVNAKYDLRDDELAVLLGACKTTDRIVMLEKAHADLGQPFLTRGSMGQDVIHPLIAEMRAQESHQAALLAKLKLPDVDPKSGSGSVGTNPARAAAASRWKHGS